MKLTASVAFAMAGALMLAGVLLATPGGSVYRAVVAQGTSTSTLTLTATSTATGTPAVTLTPAFTPTPTSTPTVAVTLTPTPTPTSTSTVAVTLTPTPTPTFSVTFTIHVYLPYISRAPTPRPTPTPTATPTFTPMPTATPTPVPIQFAGKTDQNQDVTLVVRGDLSVVTQLRIPITVVCGDQRFWNAGDIPLPGGLPITDRRFTIRLLAGWSAPEVPVYDEYSGEFDAEFSTVQGTWHKWGVLDQPVCDNTGTWSASRQP